MTIALADPSVYASALVAGCQPAKLRTISEFADQEMRLPSWSSEPGPWRTSRTPYLKEIMDCLSPSSPVQRVVFMKPAQIGATECGKNWIGATIVDDPTTMMVVEPTVDVAKKFSKQRVAPMLRDVPCLRGLVSDAKERDANNTILAKEFLGGILVMTGANSGPGLRFMSVQKLFLDEVDAYPFDVDGEGSPIEVAEKRTTSYGRAKVYLASTPLLKATSVIAREYEASDQRHYLVPCPHCGTFQVLSWAGLKWPKGQPEQAEYECETCSRMIPEHRKGAMFQEAYWQPTYPERKYVAGFHLNALYAPYGWKNSWARLAMEWSEIIHKQDRRRQQAFVNLNLAETWTEDESVATDSATLQRRCEAYDAEVPSGAVVLTAAVDVQRDRLECEVIGWGVGEEAWSVEKRILYGPPALPMEHADSPWRALDEWRDRSWTHASGVAMKIALLLIDSSDQTKAVYGWVKGKRRVLAAKGSSEHGVNLIAKRTIVKDPRGVWLISVGTNAAKDVIFDRLALTDYGPGYMHFPNTAAYDEEYFRQLVAESRVPKYDRGVLVGYTYKKIRARNEELDLWVYNMAALAVLNPNLAALTERMAHPKEPVPVKAEKPDQPENLLRNPWPPKVPPNGNWTTGWRR